MFYYLIQTINRQVCVEQDTVLLGPMEDERTCKPTGFSVFIQTP